MKISIGLVSSVFMPMGAEKACAGNSNINSDFYLGLIHAEVLFKNCTVEIVINDIPIVRYTSNDDSFQTKLVPEYLVAGTNKLEIIINPGSTPGKYREKYQGKINNGIVVKARLVQYHDEEMLDGKGGKTLTQIDYNNNEQKSISYPQIISTTAVLPDSIPIWAWQQAEKLVLPRDTTSVTNLLEQIREGFQNFNADKTFELNKIPYEEDIKIYTKGIVLTMDEWKEELEYDMKSYKHEEKENWTLKKIDSKDFSLRLCANDRLIECIAKDWKPIIRSKSELNSGGYFYFKVYVGKVKGGWKIIRSAII